MRTFILFLVSMLSLGIHSFLHAKLDPNDSFLLGVVWASSLASGLFLILCVIRYGLHSIVILFYLGSKETIQEERFERRDILKLLMCIQPILGGILGSLIHKHSYFQKT